MAEISHHEINKTLSFTPDKTDNQNSDIRSAEEGSMFVQEEKALKPRKPQMPSKGIGRPSELSSQSGQRPGRGRRVSTIPVNKCEEAFGEDITNKKKEDETSTSNVQPPVEAVHDKDDLLGKKVTKMPMKPRAPEGKGGLKADGRGRSFRQSKGTNKEKDDKEAVPASFSLKSPVTPQRSSSSSSYNVTPSAAEFESPQPFAHRVTDQSNPFETPMISFVENSDRTAINSSIQGHAINSDHDAEGMYAQGDDFAKLLEDLDNIERQVIDAHESPDPHALSESPMEVLFRNSGHGGELPNSQGAEGREGETDGAQMCAHMGELVRDHTSEMHEEAYDDNDDAYDGGGEGGEMGSSNEEVYDFGIGPLAPLDQKSAIRHELKMRSEARDKDHKQYMKAIAAANTPPRERRRRKVGSLGGGIKLKGHHHKHQSMRVIPESNSLMLTRLGGNSLKYREENEDDDGENSNSNENKAAAPILPVQRIYHDDSDSSASDMEGPSLATLAQAPQQRLPTPAYLPCNSRGVASSRPIVVVSSKYASLGSGRRHGKSFMETLGKTRHGDAYGRWMESQAISKGKHTSSMVVAIKMRDVHSLALCLRVVIQDGVENEAGIDVDEKRDDHGNSALILCAMAGWKQGCRALLKWGANLCVTNRHGNCALHFSSEFGRTSVEKLLLRRTFTYLEQRGGGSSEIVDDCRCIANVRGLRWNERCDASDFTIYQHSSRPPLVAVGHHISVNDGGASESDYFEETDEEDCDNATAVNETINEDMFASEEEEEGGGW